MMTDRYAVIGCPIEHSLSPLIHTQFAQQTGLVLTYEKIVAEETEFESMVVDFFKTGGKGLNVTLPYKERAFKLADVTTPRAREAKAANTLWMHEGKLHADTTDGIGLVRDLSRYITLKHKRVLLLGAGGAARSVIGALFEAEIAALTVLNRTASKAKALQQDFPSITLEIQGGYDVVLNATSALEIVLPNHCLTAKTYCYDFMYNQKAPTPFVTWARSKGCEARDGFGMLVEQAVESFWIWHGVRPRSM